MITIPPWMLMAGALPVLITGEWIVSRVRLLSRVDLPGAVVGGLIVAIAILAWNVAVPAHTFAWATKSSAGWWTWLVTPETQWHDRPSKLVYLPLSTAFFTCVGINASWRVVRTGSWQLALFLAIGVALGLVQNLVGVGLARAMDRPPVLGLICGSVSLTGGPSTALAFADKFEQAGLPSARSAGAAAAMFGIVCGSLFGGLVGGRIIRYRRLREPSVAEDDVARPSSPPRLPLLAHLRVFAAQPLASLLHLLLLLTVIKCGAWVSLGIEHLGLTFPVYVGGLVLAIIVRNLVDLSWPGLMQAPIISSIGGIALGLFLAAAISSLNLAELSSVAGPMLVILSVQVVVMILFAALVTFTLMGRDYDAAVMSAGHVGFGLGISANAVATIDVLTAKFGPSPRALLVVSLVGAFLIDIGNSLLILASLRWLV